MSVSETAPTTPDLREKIRLAIGDPGAFVPRAKERGAGGQYESVPQWAARAVGSLVWPLVAEARAEADMHRRTRLRVERVLDEALGSEEKDGTGEGLAADVRLAITRRDEEIERLRVELERHQVLASFFTGDGSQPNYPGTPSFKAWIDTSQELATAQRELDRQRESRIAWAIEADGLEQSRNLAHEHRGELLAEVYRLKRALATHLFDGEAISTREAIRVELIEQQHAELTRQRESRAALSSLLRGMARRVGEVRGEMRFATKHVDGWVKLADRLMSQRDRYRQAVSDQTPATPDDAVQSAVVADLRERAERYRDRCVGKPSDGAHAFAAQVLDHLAMGYEIALPEPAPSVSDVPGLNPDCTADEAACVHGQTADGPGFACVACDGSDLPHTCSRGRADAATTSCETCQRPRSIHVCRACSPDGVSAGPGCINCRQTGWDQTPCLPPAADLAGLATREDTR